MPSAVVGDDWRAVRLACNASRVPSSLRSLLHITAVWGNRRPQISDAVPLLRQPSRVFIQSTIPGEDGIRLAVPGCTCAKPICVDVGPGVDRGERSAKFGGQSGSNCARRSTMSRPMSIFFYLFGLYHLRTTANPWPEENALLIILMHDRQTRVSVD
jgi:hypothetical protein